jgi:predicted anti-sigma-YlaC factor YlaD
MNEPKHGLDEALISGYLDGELSQGEAQRVRIHLEDCVGCRAIADELGKLKEATMSSEFKVPDDGWDETPRGGTSRILRNAGLVVGLAWIVGIVMWLIWELANDPEGLVGLLLVGGFLLSAGLILASVLIDRRRAMKTDRYRRVKK